MKKIGLLFISVFLFLFSTQSFAEKQKIQPDFGIFVGTSYYMGDMNPSQQFYQPSLAGGLICRLSLNKRYALRFNAFAGQLKGNMDIDELNIHESFSTFLGDISAQFEINFMPYMAAQRTNKNRFSPYIAFGIGMGLTDNSHNNVQFVIPFGAGVKYNITSRISGGVEWAFRKTFTDGIDYYDNFGADEHSLSHNNDWYSFAGIFITYKFFKFAEKCPVYIDAQ
jgi:hypothetical protein